MADSNNPTETFDYSFFSEEMCVICCCAIETQPVQIGEKGLRNILQFCDKRQRPLLKQYLNDRTSMAPAGMVLVHPTCRRDFTDNKRVSLDVITVQVPPKKLRSDNPQFDYMLQCFLCCEPVIFDKKNPSRKNARMVTSLPMRSTLLDTCQSRGDPWGDEVKVRLLGCIDLVAAEAVYHYHCLKEFSSGRTSTLSVEHKGNSGRKTDCDKQDSFDQLCVWLETEAGAELYTVAELHDKLVALPDILEVYTVKRLKQKLLAHYGEFIFIANMHGKNDVVCFRDMAKHIVNEKWYTDRKSDIGEEATRIIITAAKLIRAQLQELNFDTDYYPIASDLSDIERNRQWIPAHLQTLLQILIPSSIKQVSLGQSIVQSARPNSVISPILFGLGVELDHVFGSKWLLTELSSLGFSVSYDEVGRYKQSVLQSETPDEVVSEACPGTFTQWVGDNVDHNVATIDGKGSFHGMGIIAVLSSQQSPLSRRRAAIARHKRLNVVYVTMNKGLTIHNYTGNHDMGLSKIQYKPLVELMFPYTLPSNMNADLLWQSGYLMTEQNELRPNWSGYMQHVFDISEGGHKKSEVIFLPIIDMNPSDYDCIYSTLLFVEKQADKLGNNSPCITFDQPLWIKAVDIIKSKSLRIVCRLGGFHVMMSFLGSIGAMMRGSGLEEALECAYGSNTVQHMMSGKAVSRALRGHFLADAALNKIIINRVTEKPEATNEHEVSNRSDLQTNASHALASTESSDALVSHRESKLCAEIETSDIQQLKLLYKQVDEGSVPIETAVQSKELLRLGVHIEGYTSSLAKESATAKLWLQYCQYIQTLKDFIRSDRTCDWNLHIVSISKMINLFAATGHIHYAKSCRLYLQMMIELPNEHPHLYKSFIEHGFHAVRRSSRYWAGIPTDLVIEQVLMRSVKSRGGLTRGRGVTESVRTQWIQTMHRCAEIHDAMTDLTEAKHRTSEQHVELGKSRIKRDNDDLSKIGDWFGDHDPFATIQDSRLRSVSSGLTANDNDNITCDRTEEIGYKIQKQFDGKEVPNVTLRKKDQIRSLDCLKPGVKIDNEKISINPMVLFSRLIAIAQREDDPAPFFAHELSPVPTALFKDTFMRKPAKSQLGEILTESSNVIKLPEHAAFVVDGGALLHRVKWSKDSSYIAICEQYSSYLIAKYGSVTVVFDGYEQGPSIKDHEHSRRAGKTCADINVTESTKAHPNQELFLSNSKNKSQFIKLLARVLEDRGHTVQCSSGDADTLIVSSAVGMAFNTEHVVVVADDTDILALLVYHWASELGDVYLLSEARKTSKNNIELFKIGDVILNVGKVVASNILFIHAWTGCDTTSAIFGQGKTNMVRRTMNEDLQRIADVMCDLDAEQEDIGHAGAKMFVRMYNGKKYEYLNMLRYAKFMEMVSSGKGPPVPEKLPPTERAAFYHSLRVHLQIMIWKTLENNILEPHEWGWQAEDAYLVPIMTDIAPAPEALLKFVRCKCKLSSKNPCGSKICMCRKNGLKCVVACGDCRGSGCNNSEEITFDDGFDAGD